MPSHPVDAALRLAEAEDLADAAEKEITPANTVDTYDKSWRVWTSRIGRRLALSASPLGPA